MSKAPRGSPAQTGLGGAWLWLASKNPAESYLEFRRLCGLAWRLGTRCASKVMLLPSGERVWLIFGLGLRGCVYVSIRRNSLALSLGVRPLVRSAGSAPSFHPFPRRCNGRAKALYWGLLFSAGGFRAVAEGASVVTSIGPLVPPRPTATIARRCGAVT